MSNTVKLNIRACSACSENHIGLTFYHMTAGPIWVGALPYFWAAICPNTGEVIVSDYLTEEDAQDPAVAGPVEKSILVPGNAGESIADKRRTGPLGPRSVEKL